MSLTRFPHGIYAPIIVGAVADKMTTGNVWFVHNTGSNSNSGKDPEHPFATIDKAISMCTASHGDVVYVMEAHNESLTAATSLVFDVIGVSVIGLGEGQTRPILDYDGTSGKINVTAANCKLANVVLRTSVSACAIGVDVDATDFTLANCEATYEATGDDFLRIVDARVADRLKIIGCNFIAEQGVNGCKSGIAIRNTSEAKVIGNTFSGNFATAIVNVLGTVGYNLLIAGNVGRNDDATAGRSVYMAIASGGLIADNRFTTAYTGPMDNTFDPGVCGCVENYVAPESGSPNSAMDYAGVRVPFAGGQSDWQIAYCDATAFAGGTTNARGDDAGTKDPMALFKVRGVVECQVFGVCGTTITGATAGYAVGVTGATGLFVAMGSAGLIDAGHIVHGAFTQTGLNATAPTKVVRDCSIMEWINTDNVKTGYLDFICRWRPLKPGSNVEPL